MERVLSASLISVFASASNKDDLISIIAYHSDGGIGSVAINLEARALMETPPLGILYDREPGAPDCRSLCERVAEREYFGSRIFKEVSSH